MGFRDPDAWGKVLDQKSYGQEIGLFFYLKKEAPQDSTKESHKGQRTAYTLHHKTPLI